MWRKTTNFELVNIFKSFFGLIYQIFIYYCRGDKPRSPYLCIYWARGPI